MINSKRILVTGGTKSDVAAMAVFVINIKETNSHLFEKIVIFHDGISKKDQEKIKQIFNIEFILYHYGVKSRNDIIVNYFSPMLFCKYECFKLLEKYEEVVWSDYDVVVLDKLDEICTFKEKVFFNIVTDGKNTSDMFWENIQNEEIKGYDLDREGVCTPLFAISNKIRNAREICKWFYKKTKEYDQDLKLPEQAIISIGIQEFKIRYQSLDASVYACHPNDATGREIILHSYGNPKFWNGLYNKVWNERYNKWLSMGGSPYSDGKKKLRAKIRLILSRMLGIKAK